MSKIDVYAVKKKIQCSYCEELKYQEFFFPFSGIISRAFTIYSNRKIDPSCVGDKGGCWGHDVMMPHLMTWTQPSLSVSRCGAHHCMTNSSCYRRRADRPPSEPCVCSGSSSFLVSRRQPPHRWLGLVQPCRKKRAQLTTSNLPECHKWE